VKYIALYFILLLSLITPVFGQIDSSSTNPMNLFDDIFKVYKEENYQKAIQLSEIFLDRYNESSQYPYILVIQINSYYQLGNFDEAMFRIKEFEANFSKHTSLHSVLFLKALIYKDRFDYGKASEIFLRIFLNEKNDKYLIEKIQSELDFVINQKLLIKELKALLLYEMDSYYRSQILYRLAFLLYENKKYDESLLYWQRLKEENSQYQAEETQNYIDNCIEFTRIKNSIAVIGPMAGKYQAYGEDLVRAVSIAVDYYNQENTNKMKIISLDNDNDPVITVNSLKESITKDNILAVIGPLRATNAIAAAVTADYNHLPLLSPTVVVNGFSDLGESIFQLSSPNYIQGELIAEYAISEENMNHFVIFAPSSQYGKKISESFIELVTNLGGKIIDSVYYQEEQTDFRTLFKRIKNNIETDSNFYHLIDSVLIEDEYRKIYKVDGIFIPASTIEEVMLIIPQFASELIVGRFIGNRIWLSKEINQMDPNLIENTIIGSDQIYAFDRENKNPERERFIRDYENRYQVEPEMVAMKCFDAARLVLNSFQLGNQYPQAITNHLRTVIDFPGITGRISLNKYNGANSNCFFYEIKNGIIYRKK